MEVYMRDSIILYSSPTCGMCEMIKRELKRHDIKYISISDVQEMRDRKVFSVPTLEVDGIRYVKKEALQFILKGGLDD